MANDANRRHTFHHRKNSSRLGAPPRPPRPTPESGVALLVVMFMLGLVSILGLVLTMRATTEARIGDNSESHMRAVYAALSGLEHARMLARGIEFDAWLRGPDGVCDNTPAYRAEARRFSFRLPVPVATAQRLDIAAPLADLGATSDDGVPNTGLFSGSPGTELIPRLGIAQWAGPFPASRYFVKVADNNGEASELAGDAGDDPFSDGDGIVIVRAVGVAGTFAEQVGANIRRNSVAVYESRLKRAATWNLGAAMTVVGPAAAASFTGTPEIAGGDAVGIGVLDTAPDDGASPEAALRAAAASGGTVSGGGLSEPSVRDLTAAARADRDKAWLLDASRLQGFATRDAPQAADRVYDGGQLWTASSTPPLGAYDKDLPWNAPSQAPRVTLVRGDLAAPDGLSGAGVLVVTGGLECAGTLDWRGLILVLGEGRLSLDAGGPGVAGGLVVGKLTGTGAGAAFGAPEIEIGGATKVTADRELVRMALRLFPVERVGFREIAGIDP